jgi:nucleotide-binding universal stress UspA family protein
MTHGARPVVVGVDGSDASLAALDWAIEEASTRHLPLELVHCLPWAPPVELPVNQPNPYFPNPPGRLAAPSPFSGEGVLEEAATRCRLTAPDVRISTTLTVSAPTGTLIERSSRAELVVLGAVGHGRRPGVGIGSVADVVTSYARCSVVVVRGDRLTAATVKRPVLVGVDGDGSSTELLSFAFDEAARRETRLVALHSWTYRGLVEAPENGALESLSRPGFSAQRAVSAALTGWRDKYPEVAVEERTVRDRPGSALVAESACSQLVVVGARGYRGLAGTVLGSVSQEVVGHARCPVAVVRPTFADSDELRSGLHPVASVTER